ncbi:SMC-Scp complex subunit ScpB [Salinicola rhizosphaerae]|uniref:Segregation and condensation protein B n=1 Tax=Salinicola rhizosphaerae TaxID=1443141 RepID=A0ABQ3DYW1_9GAMM|nr:SMC-Scp complex subunit ScpB [Salinicola rhizosphaerae]GHB18000.1 segregation and condensation protein B [Salinicola rhizosphaerae]
MNRLTDPYQTPALDEILEALLLAAGEPLSLERLESVFPEGLAGSGRPPSRAALRESLAKLGARLSSGGALELQESASGYQVRILQRYSPWVSRLWEERPQRYSRALLETLALIAYRQPVTRADIEEVRGVAVSSSIMRTLVERGWIRIVGHRDVPGRPAVYATTRTFLDDLGLKTLDALPPMHELKEFETFETSMPMPPVDEGSGAAPASPAAAGDDSAADNESSATSAHADDDEHAETASPGQSLSFAELEARLTERARQHQSDDSTRADDAPASADTPEASDEQDKT